MNFKQLEAALFAGAAAWLAANKATVANDLKPLENAAATQIVAIADKALAGVPIFGGIVSRALEGDKTAIVAAFAQGVNSGVDYLIAFCNGYAKALAA